MTGRSVTDSTSPLGGFTPGSNPGAPTEINLLRVSYSGYYATLPRLRDGFDSRYPLPLKQKSPSGFFVLGGVSLRLRSNLLYQKFLNKGSRSVAAR